MCNLNEFIVNHYLEVDNRRNHQGKILKDSKINKKQTFNKLTIIMITMIMNFMKCSIKILINIHYLLLQ